MNSSDIILEQIKRYMKEHKITYRDLAEKLGYSHQNLYLTLNGDNDRAANPGIRTLEKICHALNLDIILVDKNE